MKAMVCRRYGSPDVLELAEVTAPTPGDDEILIRVRAASINSWDWDNLRGEPLWVRIWAGPLKPHRTIAGADVAGTVEAVGRNVTRFRPGDAVFGDLCAHRWGAFAQYALAREADLASKPAELTFEQAAALPQAAVMALQGIREYGQTRAGQRVLINGAGGGVGSFAVQLAKSFGAEVTGVDRASKQDFMRSLGAEHVVDFEREDACASERRYDVILDVVAYRSSFDYVRILQPGGVYVVVGGAMSRILQLVAVRRAVARFGKRLELLVHAPNKDLAFIGELVASGKLAVPLDGGYQLQELPAAFRRFGEGAVCGKAVVTVA